jgi:hypothetical protein
MERRPMRIRENSAAGQNLASRYKTISEAARWISEEEPLPFPSSTNKGINNAVPITVRSRRTYSVEENMNVY